MAADELFSSGVYYATHGDLQRSEQYLDAARQRGYDEGRAVSWLVRVCIVAGRYQSALGHATSYLKRNPKNWALRLVVASIHEALGNSARARSELEAIVEAQPSAALAHFRLALWFTERYPSPKRAKRHLQAYLRLEPRGPHGAQAVAMLDAIELADSSEEQSSSLDWVAREEGKP